MQPSGRVLHNFSYTTATDRNISNAVELIVSIIALVKNEVDIVQESLIGSMLSNLLLVMGMCFFFRRHQPGRAIFQYNRRADSLKLASSSCWELDHSCSFSSLGRRAS